MLGYTYALFLKGKTVKEVAQDLGIQHNTLSKAVRGVSKTPNVYSLLITNYFNVPISLLEKETTSLSRYQIDTLIHSKDADEKLNSTDGKDEQNDTLFSMQGIIYDLEKQNRLLTEELKVYSSSTLVNKNLSSDNRRLRKEVSDLERDLLEERNKLSKANIELNTLRIQVNAYFDSLNRTLRILENLSVNTRATLIENSEAKGKK